MNHNNNRTYKVISGWSRNNFNETSKRYIPSSIKLLLLQFIGIYYYEIKINKVVKAIFVGDSGVGKSSIVRRFVKNEFNEWIESTIGAAFLTKTVQIEPYNEIKFEIWDTAGRERYHSLAPMYWRGAQVGFIVFDLTDKTTFERAKHWLHESEQMQLDENVIINIVGNKTDLCNDKQLYNENEAFLRNRKREIKKDDVIKFINGRNILYWETSAKTGENVFEMFEFVANELCNLYRESNNKTVIDDDGINLIVSNDEIVDNNYGCSC